VYFSKQLQYKGKGKVVPVL